jgi:hypothetical protein
MSKIQINSLHNNSPNLFKELNDQVLVFYKGTCLQYPRELLPLIFDEAKKFDFGKDMSVEEMLEQMDIFESAIRSTHKHTGYHPEVIFKKAMPDYDPQVCACCWILNIVCLLQRKAIKNDEMNGYLFFNNHS